MNVELSDEARSLLQRERTLIAELRDLLDSADANPEDFDDLRNALRDLEGLFMLVVCGEYNAGKSTFVNSLMGQRVMLEGVTPTTDRITILTYGDKERSIEEGSFVLRREVPLDILRDIAFVDTPGTNAVIKRHQELTEDFIPRADLVLFVTSADRPFSESEREFLELIRSWGKKIIIVINKMDILESAEEREKVTDFVREQAKLTLDIEPQVFGISARSALRAKEAGDADVVLRSGLRDVEDLIQNSVIGGQRLELKMKNPLGVALRISENYDSIIAERLSLLEGDRATLAEIERQREMFNHDLKRDFSGHMGNIKNALIEVERRGDIFFDDRLRMGKVFDLMNSDKVKADFEKEVIRNADADIDNAVGEMADWFISRNLQVWEDVMGFVQKRQKASQAKVMGEVGSRFQYDRDNLIRNIDDKAQSVLLNYDRKIESAKLAESFQGAVVRSGLLGLGGIGLGAATVAFLSGAMLDITGLALGLAVAGMGLLVLPTRRRKAKKELHNKMQELRDGLESSLASQFDIELSKSNERLDAAISPYTRFVRSELGRLDTVRGELSSKKDELMALRADIEDLS